MRAAVAVDAVDMGGMNSGMMWEDSFSSRLRGFQAGFLGEQGMFSH